MPTIEKQGYKYTEEFGYIPEDWMVKQLSELGNFKNGLNKDKSCFGHGTKFVNISDVFEEKLNIKNLGKVQTTTSDINTYNLEEGDILFIRSSVKPEGVGYTTLVPKLSESIVYCGFIIRFRLFCKDNVNSNYLNYYLRSTYFRKNLLLKSTVSANTNINQDALKDLYIVLPNINEQEKIAEVLGDVDSLIDKTQQLIDKKKALKTAAMQKLLTPKDNWEVVSLSKYAYVFIGLVTTMTTNYVKNGVPLIRNSDIKTNKIIRENLIQLDSKFAEEYNNRKLKIGDIVTVHTGDVGTSAIIDKTLEGAIGFATLNTRVDKNKLLPQFLCWYFNSEKFLTECLLASTGDGRQNLNLYDFIEFNIPVPPIEEQKQISDILDAIHVEIENLEKELNKYKDLKTGMMQQLLTGKVRLI